MTPASAPRTAPEASSESFPRRRLEGDGAGFVREDWQLALHNAGLARVDDFLQAQGTALSKPGLGWRYRARLEFARDSKAETVYLKRFENEPWPRQLQRWYEDGRFSSPAEREVNVAAALTGAGLTAAEPIAWGSRGSAFAKRSFVLLKEVAGKPVHHYLKEGAAGVAPPDWRRRCQLARALAQEAARFHQAGWRHRDFYLCHWFVKEIPDGLRLSLIDLQRVFRPRWRRQRWLVKDLAQLHYSARAAGVSCALSMRFFRAYIGGAKLAPAQKDLLRRILRKTSNIARHDRSAAARQGL